MNEFLAGCLLYFVIFFVCWGILGALIWGIVRFINWSFIVF